MMHCFLIIMKNVSYMSDRENGLEQRIQNIVIRYLGMMNQTMKIVKISEVRRLGTEVLVKALVLFE